MKKEKIIWKILTVDSIKCMSCGGAATLRASIPWDDAGFVHPCLCGKCTEKPAYQIIEEVLKNT